MQAELGIRRRSRLTVATRSNADENIPNLMVRRGPPDTSAAKGCANAKERCSFPNYRRPRYRRIRCLRGDCESILAGCVSRTDAFVHKYLDARSSFTSHEIVMTPRSSVA
jgi:hypothetical protein